MDIILIKRWPTTKYYINICLVSIWHESKINHVNMFLVIFEKVCRTGAYSARCDLTTKFRYEGSIWRIFWKLGSYILQKQSLLVFFLFHKKLSALFLHTPKYFRFRAGKNITFNNFSLNYFRLMIFDKVM